MALDDTVGGANANAYVDVVFADDYFTNHVLGSAWATSAVKPESLIHATRMLDSLMDWEGEAQTTTQALDWPRVLQTGEYDGIIPDDLEWATCELALHLITEGSTVTDDSLSSIKAGSITLKFNDNRPTVVLPHLVSSMLSSIGTMKQGFGGQIDTPTLLRV